MSEREPLVRSQVVSVPLGPASYDITIGAGVLEQVPEILARCCPADRYAVIADSTVAGLLGARVTRLVAPVGRCDLFPFPAGEWNKTREQWQAVSDALLASGVGRDGAVIALGGGVTGDLAGFVAATYLRGLSYMQLPTSLLAMIDSSIGGKTGVDTTFGKNLIGAFHQPRAVVADVSTLASLPPVHVAAGVAEALKHGAIADAEYFSWVNRQRDAVVGRDPETLVTLVARSVAIKAEVVGADEREAGRRAVLNLGHTVSHAIEAVSGYETLHGEAVAIGMVLESELGARLGLTEAGTSQALREAVEAFGLPSHLPDIPPKSVLDVMAYDKKNRRGAVKFAFLRRIGEVARGPGGEWTFEAPDELLLEVLGDT